MNCLRAVLGEIKFINGSFLYWIMENLLKKRVTRKTFLKSCALIIAAIVAGLGVFGFFKKGEGSGRSYGLGRYGG